MNRSLLNKSGGGGANNNFDGYNSLRDNAFFNKFAVKYNEKLKQAFEEVDQRANNEAFQKDVLGYMEQNNELRVMKRQLEQD